MEQKRAERVERLVGGCGGSSAGGAEGFRVAPSPFYRPFFPIFPRVLTPTPRASSSRGGGRRAAAPPGACCGARGRWPTSSSGWVSPLSPPPQKKFRFGVSDVFFPPPRLSSGRAWSSGSSSRSRAGRGPPRSARRSTASRSRDKDMRTLSPPPWCPQRFGDIPVGPGHPHGASPFLLKPLYPPFLSPLLILGTPPPCVPEHRGCHRPHFVTQDIGHQHGGGPGTSPCPHHLGDSPWVPARPRPCCSSGTGRRPRPRTRPGPVVSQILPGEVTAPGARR